MRCPLPSALSFSINVIDGAAADLEASAERKAIDDDFGVKVASRCHNNDGNEAQRQRRQQLERRIRWRTEGENG